MLETFREYFPYGEVEVMTGYEIVQLRKRIADNDYYYNNKYIHKDFELETTYIFAYEIWDIDPITGQYREVCIEVYKD